MSGGFTSPDSRLQYDFDTGALLEIEINKRWSKVDCNVFRSWSGRRRINGKRYPGPNYYFLSNVKVKK
jgi:hypothetical protein